MDNQNLTAFIFSLVSKAGKLIVIVFINLKSNYYKKNRFLTLLVFILASLENFKYNI